MLVEVEPFTHPGCCSDAARLPEGIIRQKAMQVRGKRSDIPLRCQQAGLSKLEAKPKSAKAAGYAKPARNGARKAAKKI